MRLATTSRPLTLLFALVFPAACSSPDVPAPGLVVPDGKADDFLSLDASEFVVSGRATVTVEEDLVDADEETRLARVRELVGYQQIAIAWFLNQYLIDKTSSDANAGYGGFSAMTRANTYESLDLATEDGRTYSFYFEQLVAGDANLISKLPTTEGPNGEHQFTLVLGTPSNRELAQLETNYEWYRRAPWSAWNPAAVDASKRTELTVSIRPEVASQNAWFDYPALFEDGRLDIDIHFGWDYHNDFHVRHATSLFYWLRRNGFDTPVEEFSELTRESGAFTRTLNAGGREVLVEVRIFYGQDGTETDPGTDAGGRVLEEDMRASLASRDVIVYSGHSGPFYGFALANWRATVEGDLDDSEMSSVEMPSERYQIVLAEGCDTYQIGEAFRRNPAKPNGRFIDVITTTAPSNASSPTAVMDFVSHLIARDAAERHDPAPIHALLQDLGTNSIYFRTMYGVHGIDDNPRIHPWADRTLAGQACATDADCGGPGNRCVATGGLNATCAPSCTADDACGEGFTCRELASRQTRVIYDAVCVPAGP